MTSEELKKGFGLLNELAEAEYHQSLDQMLRDAPSPVDPSLQIGRLIGVMLKQPFAKAVDLPRPSPRSGAYRAWELASDDVLTAGNKRSTWQYQALERLAEETGYRDAHQLALDAHFESGFFACLARSTAKYICGDAKIRKDIKKAVDEAKRSGLNISVTSPEVVVGAAGLSLGILLIQSVPILGVVGAPVIAGFVLIIYRIGVDAFCDWTRSYDVRGPLERL